MPAPLLLLLIFAAAGAADEISQPAETASLRGLRGASILPAVSAFAGPLSGLGGMSLPPVSSLLGQPGTPSPPSPKRYYRVNCDNPKPTFVLIPGITGSQLDGTSTGNVAGCPSFSSPRQVWADLTWLKNLQCFAHMMSVVYDPATKRYSNSSGTQLWAWEAGYPDGTDFTISSTYYSNLWSHLERNYGYKRGVNAFAAPYDFRLDLAGLNQIGQFEQMAARITAGVQQNCGQKAVLLTHSMGANFVQKWLREPRFQAWKQQNIKALIMVGGTMGGAGVSTWQTKLSGILDGFPAVTNAIPAFKVAAMPTTPLDAAIYQMLFGMPSVLALLPLEEPLGKDSVAVKTPSRDYTLGQQKELLKDMGDEQSLLLIDQVVENNKAVLAGGPIPGIESFCIYSINQPTPLTLVYGEDIKKRQVMRRPVKIVRGPGDGTVPVSILRLCNKIVQPGNIVEITDPSVDHSGVTREPSGLAGLDTIFAKLGMRKGSQQVSAQQVSEPQINRAAPQKTVVEEKAPAQKG